MDQWFYYFFSYPYDVELSSGCSKKELDEIKSKIQKKIKSYLPRILK
jgi:hypothetical protein